MPTVARVGAFTEFFARMWGIDIACPSCGTLHLETAKRRWHRNGHGNLHTCWDPLLSYFRCRECGVRLVLGMVAWKPPHGGPCRWPPADHLPKPWALAQMRALNGPGGFLLDHHSRLAVHQEANLLIEAPCSCLIDPDGRVQRNKDCAVHGQSPAPLTQHPDPRWGRHGVRDRKEQKRAAAKRKALG